MFLDKKIYVDELNNVISLDFINWERLKDTSILISGACGLIGSYLIDVIMKANAVRKINCKVYALGRNTEKAYDRFEKYWNDSNFCFCEGDINESINLDVSKIDYVIHLASNTHPKAYATYPIDTITTNIIGTKNMLDFAGQHSCRRFLFSSSCEIYGENRGDVEKFDEQYLGYIDCNTLRAGYPESKRCGEALCQAYITQKNMNIVIARLSRIFGPTMLMNDSKALSQFIKNSIKGEDIVLKSDGKQYYSYLYVADAVTGILDILLNGKNGEAYNVSDEQCDIRLRELAELIAKITDTKVVYALPDEVENRGFSKATKARLENEKIKKIGWKVTFPLPMAIKNTIEILK